MRPGIKEFGVVDFDKGEVSTYVADFLPHVDHCKFANCLHVNEPNCAVYEAVLSEILPSGDTSTILEF